MSINRAIDDPYGLGLHRRLLFSQLGPQELVESYVVQSAIPRRKARDQERHRLDRAYRNAQSVKRFKDNMVRALPEAPLCLCGCGLPVRSRCNGVWSQYRGNHWQRRGLR